MAESTDRPVTSRLTSTLSRTRSRPSRSTAPQLHRIFSGHYLDDHSTYYDHHHDERDDEEAIDDSESTSAQDTSESSDDSDGTVEEAQREKEREKAGREEEEEEVPEVREGIPDERDVEAGRLPLEKKKSTRSIKDPNLV